MSVTTRVEVVPHPAATLAPQVRLALQLARLDGAGLRDHLAGEAARNPFLTVRTRGRGVTSPPLDTVPDHRPSLTAHAQAQVRLCVSAPADRPVADAFVAALEPYGWLGRSVAEIAREAGVDDRTALRVLRALQGAEPTGLFARGLSECLTLQAAEKGLLDAEMRAVLSHLEAFVGGDEVEAARTMGLPAETVRCCLSRIRGLDPKPGAAFYYDADLYRTPDVIVTKGAEGWHVTLNDAATPELSVATAGADDGGIPAEERDALLAQARQITQALEHRNRSVLAVAGAVVRMQSAFLSHGPAHLRPLTRRDIAAALGYHPSTVSRICQGLLLATPRGVLRIAALFSVALPLRHGAGQISAGAVRQRIAAIVAAEDPNHPLSDAGISAALGREGCVVAPRTVGKYRTMLGLPNTWRRKGAAAAHPISG